MTESARPGSSATTVQRDLPKAAGRGDAAEHPPRVAPPLFHPLCGSNPATLLALLAGNGPVPPSQWHRLAIAALASVARWPFSVLERGSVALARRHAAAMPAPVFIIGHWRSGTTHLHNLLARSPQFGAIRPLATGLPWDLLGIVRVLRPLLEKALPVSRYVDEVAVDADSPQEDSIALANMLPLSYYHGVYFPRRFEHHFYRGVFFDDCGEDELRLWEQRLAHLLEKVCLAEQGRRLVIKNPVYTAHTARLSAMWPQARFIHIYRDPFRVLPSTRHFYATLLRQLALQPYEDLPLDRIILDGYVRLLNALYRDVPALPQGQFVEIRFEDLERAPLRELERVYATLGLADFDTDRPLFESYLERVHTYRKNVYRPDPSSVRLVARHWGAFVERWGYATPVVE